jgi:hypothetical protein
MDRMGNACPWQRILAGTIAEKSTSFAIVLHPTSQRQLLNVSRAGNGASNNDNRFLGAVEGLSGDRHSFGFGRTGERHPLGAVVSLWQGPLKKLPVSK